MDVFGSVNPGTLVVTDVQGAAKGSIVRIDGLPESALLQLAGVDKAVNFQAVPTLGPDTYCYAMGDRTSTVTASALIFEDVCGGSGGGGGFSRAVAEYDGNKADTAANKVSVTIDGWSDQGYLVGMSLKKDNPVTLSATLTLTIKVV